MTKSTRGIIIAECMALSCRGPGLGCRPLPRVTDRLFYAVRWLPLDAHMYARDKRRMRMLARPVRSCILYMRDSPFDINVNSVWSFAFILAADLSRCEEYDSALSWEYNFTFLAKKFHWSSRLDTLRISRCRPLFFYWIENLLVYIIC